MPILTVDIRGNHIADTIHANLAKHSLVLRGNNGSITVVCGFGKLLRGGITVQGKEYYQYILGLQDPWAEQ